MPQNLSLLEARKNDPIDLETLQKHCKHYLLFILTYYVLEDLKVS